MTTQYSVIIPHYSQRDSIELLLRGVKSIPTRDDIQIIVVDNSIIDICFEELKEFSNVELYHCDNSRKAGGARNVGLEHATGKWVLFLDADDFFTERAFDIFDEYKDSNYDIIYFCMTSCYSDDISKPANREEFCNKMVCQCVDEGSDYGLRILLPTPCAKMVSSRFISLNGIDFDEVPARNDVMFCLKVGLKANNMTADKRTVYCATVTEGSITKIKNLENLLSRFYVNIRKNKMLVDNGYRRTESVFPLVVLSKRFGLKIFFKLLFKALFTGNLFVGLSRWLKRQV